MLCLCLALLPIAGQAQLTNKGDLYVAKGTMITVSENLHNNTGATLHNEGSIVVNGSLYNDAAYNGGGSIEMGDAATSTSLEMQGDTVKILYLSESDHTKLSEDIFVTDSIIFNNGGGDLLLNGTRLCLADTVGFRNHNASHNIITNGVGSVLLVNFDNSITLPVAYESGEYNPITITNSGLADHFELHMTDSPTDNGTNAGTAYTSDVVDAMWILDDSVNAAYSLDLTFNWQAADEATGFSLPSDIGVAVYENGSWNLSSGDLSTISTRTIAKTGITSLDNTAFAIGDADSDFMSGLILALKVYLQGAYNTSKDSMDAKLNALLPQTAAAAYGHAPFNYKGSESFVTVPNSDVVDWVLVDVREATAVADAADSTHANITNRKRVAGLLLRDGSIVGTDGSSNLQIEGMSGSNNLHVVVRHRTHMPAMSSSALTVSNGAYTYDFTTGSSKAYTNNTDGLEQLETGVYGLYNSNTNGDHNLNVGDFFMVKFFTTSAEGGVYNRYDINMDGNINVGDQFMTKFRSSSTKGSAVR